MKKQFLLLFVALLMATMSSWANTTKVKLYASDAISVGGIATSTEQSIGTGAWKNDQSKSKMELYLPLTSLGTFTIDDIASLQFSTKKVLPFGSNLDFYWSIYTMPYTGGMPTWYGQRLTSEPMYYNGYNAPYNVWSTYTTNAAANQMTFFDSNYGSQGWYNAPTLSDLQANAINWSLRGGTANTSIDYGVQTVKYISLATGSSWNATMVSYLDNIIITLKNGNVLIVDLEEKDPTPITTIATPTSSTCGTFDVPVTIKDFKEIGAITLTMNYDPTVLAYQSVTLNSAIKDAITSGTSGQFILGSISDPSITLADDVTLFTLHFNLLTSAVSGASTSLSWSTVSGECEYAGPGGEPTYTSIFNGATLTIPNRPVKNTDTHMEYCTIQAALDATETVNGNHITVAAGTYPEQVTIAKSIHLAGSAGAIIQAPSTLPAAADPLSSIVIIKGTGVNAEINGFTVQGPGPTGCGSMGRGIFVRDGAFANIHNNQILDIRDNPFGGCQNGVAIQIGRNAWSTIGTAIITNNIITGYQKGGIVVDNAGSSATITGNTITGAGTTNVTAQNGVQISRGATATISGNTISGNSFHLTGNDSDWGACGILLYQSGAVALTGGNILSSNDQNYDATGVTGTLSLGAETFGSLSSAPVTKGYQISIDGNYNIDASSCTFEGISPAKASLTQLFYIEDRIWHDVDDNTKTGFVNVKAGNVYVTPTETGAHIQYGIDAAIAGDMVNVKAGDYGIETAVNRKVFGTGDYQFGLFIDKDNLKVKGYNSSDAPVSTASEAAVLFNTNSTADFGPSGVFVQANGVTLEGLKIGDNTGSSNKTVEVVGDTFTFNKCFINTSSDNGAFYMGCWDATHPIVTYSITNNIINNAVVSINNGVGTTGLASGRLITGNTFTGIATPYLICLRGWNGASPAQGWIVDPVGGAVITGNAFNNTEVQNYILARGNAGGYDNSQLNWNEIWTANTYGNHVVSLENEGTFAVRSYADATGYTETRRISPKIQENITIGQTGDVVLASAGTFDEQVVIDSKSLTLKGAGIANTIIKPSTASQLSSLYTYPAGTFWPGTVMASTILVKNSPTVTITGLKIDGTTVTSLPTGAERLAGILYGESSGIIDGVAVNSIKTAGYIDRSYGIDLSATSAAQMVEVKNTNISDWGRNGIQAMGAGLTANIHDNVLVGPGTIGPNNVPNGIVFIHGVGGTAKLNTISACHYTTEDWGSAGIMVYDPVKAGIVIEQNQVSTCDAGISLAMNANDVIVKLNNLHNNGNGIQLEDGVLNNSVLNNTIVSNVEGIYLNDALGAGNKAENNNISGNSTAGLENASALLFDASPNWWGNASGPKNSPKNTCGTGDQVIGNVEFIPWYKDAAMTLLNTPSGPAEVLPLASISSTVECVTSAVVPTLPIVKDACGTQLTPTGPVESGVMTGCTGTKIYTYTYTDKIGQTLVWAYTYNIIRTTAPAEVGGPVSITGSPVECASAALAPITLPVVQDVCGVVIPAPTPVVSEGPSCNGTKTFTYNYVDCAGKQFVWTYTYTIAHTTAPVVPDNGAKTVACISSAIAPTLFPTVVDQQQLQVATDLTSPNWTDFTSIGQSFTCGTSGWLNQLDLKVASLAGAQNFTLQIYQGNGITGKLLYTGSHSLTAIDWQSLNIDQNYAPYLTAGTQYTFWLTAFTYNQLGLLCMHPDVYPGGVAMDGCTSGCSPTYAWNQWPDYDLVFKTYMSPVPVVKDVCGNNITPVLASTVDSPSPLTCAGTRTYTFNYTDCSGLTTPWTYTYTIAPPALVMPTAGSSTVSCPSASQVAPTVPSVMDGCGNTVNGVFVSHDPAPSCNGDVVWTYSYTSCNNTVSNWTYTYRVVYSGGLTVPELGASTVAGPAQAVRPAAPKDIQDACGRTVHAVLVGSTIPPECEGTVVWTYSYTACDGTTKAYWTYTYTVTKSILSGTMKYNNSAKTPMGNVTLQLTPGDNVTTITDANGAYSFANLCPGTYTIAVTNNNKDVGGINATDAAQVNAWSVNFGSIEQVKFMAGDGTNNNFITSADAQSIVNRYVKKITFARAPWSYWKKAETIQDNGNPYSNDPFDNKPWPTNITVAINGNVSNFDLYAMCTGDYNGSLVPDPLKSATWSMELANNSTMNAVANQEFELPIRAASAMQVGAISMTLEIPAGLVNIQDVRVNGSSDPVVWAVNDNLMTLGWYSSTPVNVTENGNLLTLKLKSTNAFTVGQTMEFAMKFDPLNELANGNYDVIQDARLFVAQVSNGLTGIFNSASNDGLSLSNYPNPFKNSTTISYALPVQGKVTIHVYNSLGQLVKSLVDANQNAGDYSIRMDGNNLMPGIYIAKLRLTNQNVDMTGNVKLSVLK